MSDLNAEQWAEFKQLFDTAAELPAGERAAFVNRECRDRAVREELASLLEYADEDSGAEGAIASVACAIAREHDPDDWLIGARLGPYRVESIAGHGGMGAVYRAQRDDAEFRQCVAIKLVRAAAVAPDALARLKQERQILARLSHPNIARLLDGGSRPEGVPYLVMEFIEGEPITQYCRRRSMKIEDCLRLFLPVCDAVEHAHQSSIVHRDLKPANILVTPDGTPKLLDFGIAKLLDGGAESAAVTRTGLQVMTPEYASPEQVRSEPVTPASDVYSLGLILYELLTGAKAQSISEYSPANMARVVCQMEPSAPARLRPQLAGDLDNILRMALRKEPERRYRSAGEIAHDIQRYLEKRPVNARPDTLAYRCGKFVRRNRMAVTAALLLAASLLGGLAFYVVAQRRAAELLPHVLQVRSLTQVGHLDLAKGVATDGSQIYFVERRGGQWSLAEVSVEGGASAPVRPAADFIRPEIMDISPDRTTLLLAADDDESSDPNDRPLWILPLRGGAPRRLGDLMGHSAVWTLDGRGIVFARGGALFQASRDGTGSRRLMSLPGSAVWMHRPVNVGSDVLRFCLERRIASPLSLWGVGPDLSKPHPVLPGWSSAAGSPDGETTGTWLPSSRYYIFQSRHNQMASIWAMREDGGLLRALSPAPIQVYSTPMEVSVMAADPNGKHVYFGVGMNSSNSCNSTPPCSSSCRSFPGLTAGGRPSPTTCRGSPM